MLLLSKTSEASLVEIINQANVAIDVPIEVGGLYYGAPRPTTDGYVRVQTTTNYNNFEYEGYQAFEYKRINLTQVFGSTRPETKTTWVGDLHSLLPLINRFLGLNFSKSDIANTALQWGPINSVQNIEIIADPRSLGYEGSFTIQFTLVRFRLDEAIRRPVLPVLTHPDGIVPKKYSVGMLTWGIDFTDHLPPVNAILVAGMWRYNNRMREMMAMFGMPNWPSAKKGTLSLRKTSSVPRSNPAFTHVIVQENIDTETYQGTAYIHLNIV